MPTTKFEIGDYAYWATCSQAPTDVECPDCGGTGRLRVIFHDDTEVSVDCANCAPGFEPPTGRVKCYDRHPEVERVRIAGVEVQANKTTYRLGQDGASACYIVEEDRLFETADDARAAATAMCTEIDAREREKIQQKEKDTRSWAWNASYHRKEIKRAQDRIDYHTRKLNVADLKAKEQKSKATL